MTSEPSGTDPWDAVRDRLAATLAGLADEQFVVLGEPAPPPAPRRGFRRTTSASATRYVQLRRDREWLVGECVGATLFGGDWEVSAGQHERIRALGWLAPGDPDPAGTRPSYPNYWCTLPRDPAPAATAAVGALRVLGADPATLTWRTGP